MTFIEPTHLSRRVRVDATGAPTRRARGRGKSRRSRRLKDHGLLEDALYKQHACLREANGARPGRTAIGGWPSRLTIWCCFMGACFSNTRPATRNQVALTCAASSRQTESPGHIRWLARSPRWPYRRSPACRCPHRRLLLLGRQRRDSKDGRRSRPRWRRRALLALLALRKPRAGSAKRSSSSSGHSRARSWPRVSLRIVFSVCLLMPLDKDGAPSPVSGML
jgi:hypothetical protein